uniref:acid phosphatase n=1 Tax=Pectinophora gossypiella TaxID=13191 RepID=A0A1E1WMB7_PECGO
MYGYLALICFVAQLATSEANVIHGNEVIDDKQLVLAFVVHRHGDRAPDADELSLSDEQEKIRNLTRLEGLEGLTNLGKRRAYQIGKYIKQRYGPQGLGLISNLYLQDDIAIRSTDKERTKMTALVAMAAVYPPEVEQQWDEGVGKVWQPVPYSAKPLAEDFLRYYSNCNKFKALMAKAKEESITKEFLPYKDLVAKLEKKTGRNFTENPLLFETLFDLFKSQVGLGLDIPEWAKPLLPRLSEAARLAYRLYFRSDEMLKIGGGVLLQQFTEAATALALGKPVTKRLRIFSAHDFNVGALMDVSRVVKDQSIPEYGSVFALELYRRKGGVLTVEPVFLNQAGESSPQVLTIAGCGPICDLEKFTQLTEKFLLSEEKFYEVCGIKSEL